jgi:hypothetical protein
VQPDHRHSGSASDPLERRQDGVGVDRLSVAVGQHPTVENDPGRLGFSPL